MFFDPFRIPPVEKPPPPTSRLHLDTDFSDIFSVANRLSLLEDITTAFRQGDRKTPSC